MVKQLVFATFTVTLVSATPTIQAVTPAGLQELRLYTSIPKKEGESAFSISGRWVTEDDLQTGFTALAFIKGPGTLKPDDGPSMARKIASSVKRGMGHMRPNIRGLKQSWVDNTKGPHVIISNKEGFSITQMTIRDFSNEKLTMETGAESFASSGIEVALDFVDSGAISKAVINASSTSKTFRATGGEVIIALDKDKPVTIKTANKTLPEIEKAVIKKIGGSFSSSPIFPQSKEKRDKKNIKSFDGGEIQIGSRTNKSLMIDVTDPSLGVVAKFKFKQKESSGWW